ncbi:unnamed protein product [Amoebophrya sp. A25]|nr:unnamed protein product [Amoebophrya sp. A25]|eukprot:GSA25T00027118001.1
MVEQVPSEAAAPEVHPAPESASQEVPPPPKPRTEEEKRAARKADEARMVAEMNRRGYEIVPPNSDDDCDPHDMQGMSKYPSCPPDVCKEKGNLAFKEKKYKRAIKYYQGGLKGIMGMLCKGPEMLRDEKLSELDLVLNLNTAQCHISLGEPELGITYCDKALRRRDALSTPQLAKALYRKAMCYGEQKTKTRETMDILEDLLHNVDPDNKAAQQYYNVKKREWLAQKKKDKSTMKKLFGAFEKESGSLRMEKLAAQRRKLELFFGGGTSTSTRSTNTSTSTTAGTTGTTGKEQSPVSPSAGPTTASSSSSSPLGHLDENFLYVFSDDAVDLFGLRNRSPSKPAAGIGNGGERGSGEETCRDGESGSVENEREAASAAGPKTKSNGADWKEELSNMAKTMSPLELAQVCQSVKSHDRKMWPHQLRDTCLYSLMQHCLTVESEPSAGRDMGPNSSVTLWFLGASGSFELQFLDPESWLDAIPAAKIRLVCVGFLGEKTPEEADIPDRNKPESDGVWKRVERPTTSGASRECVIEAYHGKAEEVLFQAGGGCFYEKGAGDEPHMVFLLQPYLHRYLTSWWEPVQRLIEEKLPFCIIGGSEPDYSFTQDVKILETAGARVVLGPVKSPYPMRLDQAAKCHHIIVSQGGPARRGMTSMNAKLELLAADVHLVGK